MVTSNPVKPVAKQNKNHQPLCTFNRLFADFCLSMRLLFLFHSISLNIFFFVYVFDICIQFLMWRRKITEAEQENHITKIFAVCLFDCLLHFLPLSLKASVPCFFFAGMCASARARALPNSPQFFILRQNESDVYCLNAFTNNNNSSNNGVE